MSNLPCLRIARGLPVLFVLAAVGASTVRADSLPAARKFTSGRDVSLRARAEDAQANV